MQMHYQEKKKKFKNYMKNSYKSRKYKGSNRLSDLFTKRKTEL